jgi:hypothetical protein
MLVLHTVAAHAQGVTTTTTLTAQTTTVTPQSSTVACSLTSLAVGVTSAQGLPAGTVTIEDEAGGSPVPLGSENFNSIGQASFSFLLANGTHTLIAVYAGNATYQGSTSISVSPTISAQCESALVVSVSSLVPSNTLTAGDKGTATATVTPSPEFVAALGNAPAFITLSCSGMPNQASCTFTPQDLEMSPGELQGVTSTMVLQTQAEGSGRAMPPASPLHRSTPVAWAFLLPGALGLGGLAWGTRRRPWLNPLMLMALVGLVTMLGTTACNPRYYYENHGPPPVPATPSGSYTVIVTAQYSNGITATTTSTTIGLTVK